MTTFDYWLAKELIRTSGKDGLDPVAKKILGITLESVYGNDCISIEAITAKDIKEFALKIFDIILKKLKEFLAVIKDKTNTAKAIIKKKYLEWELDNIRFGDTTPVNVVITNPYLFNENKCILSNDHVFNSTDLVPSNNYRKFQLANGVMGLSGMGQALINSFNGDEWSPYNYVNDLYYELSDLIQPTVDDNYGNWGLINYDRNELRNLSSVDFDKAYEILMNLNFVTNGNSNNLELEFDDPSIVIRSIKNIRTQLETFEDILNGYKYVDTLESRIVEARGMLANVDTEANDYNRLIKEFQMAADLYTKFNKINFQFMDSLLKTLIASGDVYWTAYKAFRKNEK